MKVRPSLLRLAYLSFGTISLVLGLIGAILPLLPTVPFMLLAAFFFARSSMRLERWLIEHPQFGPHIVAWREQRAVSRRAKHAAYTAFAASALIGIAWLPMPWLFAPSLVAILGASWIARLPDAR